MISAAYEWNSVIVSTNLPFEQWTEVFGSQRLTGAVLDRLTHHCRIIQATGESYRLKGARRRSSKGTNPPGSNKPGKYNYRCNRFSPMGKNTLSFSRITAQLR